MNFSPTCRGWNRMAKRKTYRLKKDVVIPAGTVLETYPHRLLSLEGLAGREVRFTIDSGGYFMYMPNEDDEDLSEWIEEVESDEELDWVLIV